MAIISEGPPASILAPLLCGKHIILRRQVEAKFMAAAGVTMHSAIKKAGLVKDDFLVVSGAGGGLGHLYGRSRKLLCLKLIESSGVQIARAAALRVIAIDA